MNIRKNIDYSDMYEELNMLMTQPLSQMELYCEIGKTVCRRTEKGAAVMASEYLNKHYPDAKGFSPRSLRRMRNFYRTYEDHQDRLSLAVQLGWTQNIVILEADLSIELLEWYLKATSQFGWSKAELKEKIANEAHKEIALAIDEEVCHIQKQEEFINQKKDGCFLCKEIKIRYLIQEVRCRIKSKREGRRRWSILICPILTEKRIASVCC